VTSPDGRIIATENEIHVLRALHRFGWLRTRDLAALIWQRWKSRLIGEAALRPPVATASGLRMAQRTLRQLADARQVLRGKALDDSLIYALSEAGAVAYFRPTTCERTCAGLPSQDGWNTALVTGTARYSKCVQICAEGLRTPARPQRREFILVRRKIGCAHPAPTSFPKGIP
jgi:hypothetical protein